MIGIHTEDFLPYAAGLAAAKLEMLKLKEKISTLEDKIEGCLLKLDAHKTKIDVLTGADFPHQEELLSKESKDLWAIIENLDVKERSRLLKEIIDEMLKGINE
jgi:Mg/Co/Ni transporter MgtE